MNRFCIIDLDTIMEWNHKEVVYWILSVRFRNGEKYELKENTEQIETQMNELKATQSEEIENLNNTLNEANGNNDALRNGSQTTTKATQNIIQIQTRMSAAYPSNI
eukprot:610806_1